ncbi:MAG: type II toxin-antitoxin system RatA family toxin [Pseudomonadota bacterium]
MPTHTEKRRVPYTPEQMYELVSSIERYPEFLPWTSAVRIRSRAIRTGGGETVDADMVISFKVFREKFGSRVDLRPDEQKIDVAYLDGPFKYLNNHWYFIENDDGSTTIDFFVDFEFKSRILQSLIGVVFNEAMQRIVRAFEARAEALYGSGSAAPA